MQALANMLNTLLEGLLLIAYACAMGGLMWSVLLLRTWRHHTPAERVFTSRSLVLKLWGWPLYSLLSWPHMPGFWPKPFSAGHFRTICIPCSVKPDSAVRCWAED